MSSSRRARAHRGGRGLPVELGSRDGIVPGPATDPEPGPLVVPMEANVEGDMVANVKVNAENNMEAIEVHAGSRHGGATLREGEAVRVDGREGK